jgi:hypothetical protein
MLAPPWSRSAVTGNLAHRRTGDDLGDREPAAVTRRKPLPRRNEPRPHRTATGRDGGDQRDERVSGRGQHDADVAVIELAQHHRSVFDKGQPVWEHSLIFAGQTVRSHP